MNQSESPAEEDVDPGEEASEGTFRLAGCLVCLFALAAGTAVVLLAIHCPALPWWGWTGIGIVVLWAATVLVVGRLLSLGGGRHGVAASMVFAPFLALLGIMQVVTWQVKVVEFFDPEPEKKPAGWDDPERFRRYGCAAWAVGVCTAAFVAVLCIRW
ncbi:MAG: hypothetical protein ACYTFG_14215, partial [Planctomycetota bacterium]